MTFKISLTPAAAKLLADIQDARVRESIANRVSGLAIEPEKQGKPLLGDLSGLRSLRAVGQRYRVIYRVKRSVVTIIVVCVGIRKEGDRRDIYELARKLVRLGLAGRA